jgi:hypothetical protein
MSTTTVGMFFEKNSLSRASVAMAPDGSIFGSPALTLILSRRERGVWLAEGKGLWI